MDADRTTSRQGPRRAADWIAVLILALALAGAGWYAWRQWTGEVRRHSRDLAALREDGARLASTRDRLRALLQTSPCAIPDEVNGISLLAPAPVVPTIPAPARPAGTAEPAQRTGPAESGANAPPSPDRS